MEANPGKGSPRAPMQGPALVAPLPARPDPSPGCWTLRKWWCFFFFSLEKVLSGKEAP